MDTAKTALNNSVNNLVTAIMETYTIYDEGKTQIILARALTNPAVREEIYNQVEYLLKKGELRCQK